MNRNRRKLIVIAVILLLSLAFLVAYLVSFTISKLNVYELSPFISEWLTSKEPSEFVKTRGKDTPLENGYTYASVNSEGNLILILSDREVDNLKNYYLPLKVLQGIIGEERDIGVDINNSDYERDYLDFIEGAPNCGFEISEDFSKIIVTPDDDPSYFIFAMPACALMQFFEGVPSEEIRVEYVKVDDEGSTLEIKTWPDDIPDSE